MKEIWLDVVGYEGLYLISNYGNVKSLITNKILNERKSSSGYLSVMLYKDKKPKYHSIHRLVANAFLNNDSNLPFVNHKDENKANNNVNNLEWCTRLYNMNCGTISERISTKRGHKARLKRSVYQIDKKGNIVNRWESIAEAARKTGTARTSIYECCRGIHKTANGYIWNYEGC